MGFEFNKKILFDNISYLLKQREMKIGELESVAGVSPGYISRTSKDEKTKPGIDFIVNAAEALNVSVDTLMKVNMASLTPTERYLIDFIEKLTNDTQADKLDWNVETADLLNNLEVGEQGFCYHSLFDERTYKEQGETEYPESVTRVTFCSNSYDVHTWIAGNCYNLRLKNGIYVYLMNISKSYFKASDPKAHAKEIWMSPRGEINQFLCSTLTGETSGIASLIESLYAAVSENARHPKVSKSVRSAIDAFMVDDFTDDADENGDDGFPFT